MTTPTPCQITRRLLPTRRRVVQLFQRCLYRCPSLRAALGLGAFLLGLLVPSQVSALPIIYTCGDSTVQTYNSGYYPQAGWGQVLQHFFDATKVTVANKGAGGTSSKSFYENQWPAIRSALKAGDYVTIGFGINDSASDTARHTEPFTTFKDYLKKFVNDTKAKGAFPIIVATQPRNAWNADGVTIYPAYHDYPVASRQLAGEINVPLIDLDQRGIALLQSVGKTYSTYFIYKNLIAGDWPNYSSGSSDNVHFQEMGAIELAKLVVAGVRALSGDTNVSKLIPFLKPTYKVTFTSNNPSAGLITRTENFPAGVTVTAYAYPNSGFTFSNWSGSISGTKRNVTFVMGTAARTITANFAGSGGGLPAAGTYSLKNRSSGLCLDNLGTSSNGANVAQWSDGTSNNQKWVLSYPSTGVARLQCVTGSRYLDGMGRTSNGSLVAQYDSGTSNNQRWTLISVGSGYFKLKNVATGLCLDVGASPWANGDTVEQWSEGSSTNQQWQFITP